MSLNTWKKQYYPTPASRCRKADAIAHSLRKWRGLRPEALKKHKVYLSGSTMLDNDVYFIIDASSCALCRHHLRSEGEKCTDCPLHQTLGRDCDDGRGSPYRALTAEYNPEPMIAALEKTLARQQRKKKAKKKKASQAKRSTSSPTKHPRRV